MAEKTTKFSLHVRPSRLNYLGLFFTLAGFLLTLLCLVGCRSSGGQSLHFIKVADRPSNGFQALYGWQGYCIQDQGNTQCRTDSNVMTIPFDVWVTDQLNKTRPQLFEDAVQQDEDLNPLAKPNPPHDPKIYAGAILCLLCGGAAFVLAIVRTTFYQYFQDDYYARGLLASGATTLALLLLAQSSIMYQNAVQQLNVEYPHLEATEGPCMTVIGVAFTSYFIASCIFMHGFLSNGSAESPTNGGYNPL